MRIEYRLAPEKIRIHLHYGLLVSGKRALVFWWKSNFRNETFNFRSNCGDLPKIKINGNIEWLNELSSGANYSRIVLNGVKRVNFHWGNWWQTHKPTFYSSMYKLSSYCNSFTFPQWINANSTTQNTSTLTHKCDQYIRGDCRVSDKHMGIEWTNIWK